MQTLRSNTLFAFAITITAAFCCAKENATISSTTSKQVIGQSRNSCVQIISDSGKSSGTGFFISDKYIATCFHVIAAESKNGTNISFAIYPDLVAILNTGEKVKVRCISIPSQNNPEPLQSDFAILECTNLPSNQSINSLKLAMNDSMLIVGDEIYYSGYPLATPAMLTFRGMISGIGSNNDIICIQGSINRGNSGGALMSSNRTVIGILSMREGGISKGLQDMSVYIDRVSSQGSVHLMGVNPLEAINVLTKTLDTYISTGIGYAINIKYLRAYLKKNNLKSQ